MTNTKNLSQIGAIKLIPIDELFPHPDNPRKELGDLEELTESIKAKGVLQNLTVVPWFSEITRQPAENGKHVGYRVVIGHRRCAAAKKAGLTELPCVVVDMTPKEQVETMLLENIQRSDLSLKEQADGFQMMIDMGETVENVSEKTGFSKTTIRRRLKLCELDAKKFEAACKRQVRLEDFDRLNQIENVEKRNQLLDQIGTANFDYLLKNAVTDQKNEAKIAVTRAYLLSIGMKEITGEESRDYGTYRYVSGVPFDPEEMRKKLTAETMKGKLFCFFRANASVYDYRKNYEESPEAIARKEAEQKRRERSDRIEAEAKTMYELRKEFVKNCTDAAVKKHLAEIVDFMVDGCYQSYLRFDESVYAELVGTDTEKHYEYPDVKKAPRHGKEYALLAFSYAIIGDGAETCADYNNRYRRNEELEELYELLTKLGYEMSDKEKEILSGVSEIYEAEGKEKDE